MSSTDTLLQLEGVTRGFVDPQGRRQNVVQDFSLHVLPGETVALWGPSGSGKTTLLNLIAGLLPVDSGRISLVAGEQAYEITSLDMSSLLKLRRERVGYVFQFFNLIETLTVAENIRLALELAGKLEHWQSYQSRIEQLGLGGLANRFPGDLSGGEQQRVAVLRALAHQPVLVLADEPTGNLDRMNSERCADLLWQETRDQRAALLVATHSEQIAARADRVVDLDKLLVAPQSAS